MAPVATALKPLLNRFVFHGIEACRGFLDDSSARVRSPNGELSRVQVLATVAIDRIGPELNSAGLRRASRSPAGEGWVYHDALTLQIEPSDLGDDATTVGSIAREYAVLLTRAVALPGDCSVRVAGLPAQIALLWAAHLVARHQMPDCPHVEDLIEIVMRRAAIVDDVLAAPGELRQLVALAAREFVSDESSQWALRRALPDARLNPGVVTRARERFFKLAEARPS